MIRGQLEVLAAQENPDRDEVRRVERLVQAEITRISRLVDDLLVLAQAEHTDFLRTEPIDLPTFVGELWDGVSLTAVRRFELGPVPDGVLEADPDRLAQALRNLARNAIEQTVPDDRPGATRGRPRRPDRDPLLGARRRARDSRLPSASAYSSASIAPIPARSRAAGGAGLGLAIVRAIAEAHGGQVRARDSPNGHGACIELVLPGFTPVGAPTLARR